MTYGERNANINRTILLLGETGSGKSTLINALFNYTLKVTWDDEIWFHVVEETMTSKTETQTSDVIVYEFFGFESRPMPYSLTIIDTPGFGDIKGVEHDALITKRLFDLFRSEDGVKELNAVGLVLKSSVNRICDRLMYVLDSVMSLLGKDMVENIAVLFTFSDGMPPNLALKALGTANIQCAKNARNLPLHFLFNNRQHEIRTEEVGFLLQHAHTLSQKGMSEFAAFLEKNKPQKLDKTVNVLMERVRLPACIQNLQQRIIFIEEKQRALNREKDVLKKYEQESITENVTIEIEESYKDLEKIKNAGKWLFGFFFNGATRCTACEENCHYPGCKHVLMPNYCEVMKSGKCTSCRNHCEASVHVKDDKIYVTKTRMVKKTLRQIKEERTNNSSSREESHSENLEKELKDMETKRSQLLEEAYDLITKLDNIALNVDSSFTHIHLDFLIEKMAEENKGEKVQKLREMRDRNKSNKGMLDAQRYMGKTASQTQ